MKLLLGSGSPRRRELMKEMDLDFEVVKLRDIEECYPADLEKERVPEYLSRLKAEGYRNDLSDNEILVTADTVVISRGQILGKPRCREEAIAMLRQLSGEKHHVVTGVTLSSRLAMTSFSETTEVEFFDLDDAQIEYYVDKYKPFDKAGAYGIQEWIGLTAVKSISGCFYNVMGLPTPALYRHLRAYC